MKNILHKSDTRGWADYGWLQTRYTFSFADYYDPGRMNFGVLRVLNDDHIAGGGGFPMHPHKDMEIVTIMLEGELEHKDSMGNTRSIKNTGDTLDVQVMSAGTGVVHSEYNKSSSKPVKLLQIWVNPNIKNAEPRYEEITLKTSDRENKIQTIIFPKDSGEKMWINQNAWFSLGKFDSGKSFDYEIKKSGNGIYIFVISGSLKVKPCSELSSTTGVGEQVLNIRDGLGVSDFEKINITIENKAEFLVVDVPVN